MSRTSFRFGDLRVVALGLVFVLAWAGIGYRLFQVQGADAAAPRHLAIEDRQTLGCQERGEHAVVIGAGPAGCSAAACLAERGASVLLLESNPKAAKRFAGDAVDFGGRYAVTQGLADVAQGSGAVTPVQAVDQTAQTSPCRQP